MNNIIFKIQPTAETMSQLTRGVRSEGSKIWSGRALAKASIISKKIGVMLVGKFNNSAVAQALRGQGSPDLPAHFGLSDGVAKALADGMAELIRTSVRILTRGTGGSVSITIRAIEDNWGEYLGLPGAQYVSYPSNITIPVARWLLINPNIDIGQASYDIVFSGEDNRFDVRIQKVSRSGRAIMVALSTLGGGGGYVLPGIISGQGGQNFIEYTLGQPNVALEAANILIKQVG